MIKEPWFKFTLGLAAWGAVAVVLSVAGLLLDQNWLMGAGTLAWLALTGLAVRGLVRQGRARRRETILADQLRVRTAELERQTHRLAVLNEMAHCLSHPVHLEVVLLQWAERIKRALDVEAVHIHLVDVRDPLPDRATAADLPVECLGEESAADVGECTCGQVARSVCALDVTAIDGQPHLARMACAQHGDCAIASVRLYVRDQTLGVLTVQSCRPDLGDPDDMDLLGAISSQLSAAIENAQLYAEMEKRVQHLTRRVEHMAIVQERERISREIHDGVAQALALLNLRVGVAQSLLAAGQVEQVNQELLDAAQVIDAANRDVREAIAALRSTSPKGASFVPMLQEFVIDFGVRSELETEFEAVNGASNITLNPLIEVQLMRIIQEALTNVRKHAHAAHTWVQLDHHRQSLRVTIEDDGRGFDLERVQCAQNRHSFGMATMRERAEMIGGELDIQTMAEVGTRVTIQVPLETEESDDDETHFTRG
jgi:two-component system nitrate/nitrite sensor histidine kinase NarX